MADTLTNLRRIRNSVAVAYDLSADDSYVAARLKLGEVEDELEVLIASMEDQPEPTTNNSSIRGYEVGASVYRLQSEANKAINRGEGTHWVALYRANHSAQPSEQIKKVVVHADYREMWAEVVRQNQQLCAALGAQPSEPKTEQEEPSPVTLKVVNGDICIKSLDMDQSYGMWIPVTYSTEHGFVEGTCFYTK